MKLELLPLLKIQQDLHRLPRGYGRFKAYLQTLTGGTDEIQVPLVGMNPMGKEHVASLIDDLIAWGAEDFVRELLLALEPSLTFFSGELKLGLVLTDDLKGGWTNTYLTDYAYRFEGAYDLKHHWALVPLWTSQAWSEASLKRAVLQVLYRTLYKRRFGLSKTLAEMMRQEGLASVFSGDRAELEPEMHDYVQELIRPLLETDHKPVCFACLFGDEAAAVVGYSSLGLPENAGFMLANLWAIDLQPLKILQNSPITINKDSRGQSG
ncbi:MAG: hypothetical protein KC422_05625 [Trueperaceae bacterium]|nr:hypothetical protein [Trueperaceae bacterium]